MILLLLCYVCHLWMGIRETKLTLQRPAILIVWLWNQDGPEINRLCSSKSQLDKHISQEGCHLTICVSYLIVLKENVPDPICGILIPEDQLLHVQSNCHQIFPIFPLYVEQLQTQISRYAFCDGLWQVSDSDVLAPPSV